MKATILYTLARIAVFVVPFAILSLTPMSVYLAAGIAAVVGFLLSYILLGRLRAGLAQNIVRRRAAPDRDEDADLEDAALDGGAVRPAAGRTAPPAEDD